MADSDPRSKKFRLRPHQIRPVATGRGACIATDRITVDGHPVCYAYREAPDFDVDSGWRFFAGDESQEYVDNPTNSTIYDINTIANYDPDIVAILDAPARAAYQRSGRGEQFATVPYPAEPY